MQSSNASPCAVCGVTIITSFISLRGACTRSPGMVGCIRQIVANLIESCLSMKCLSMECQRDWFYPISFLKLIVQLQRVGHGKTSQKITTEVSKSSREAGFRHRHLLHGLLSPRTATLDFTANIGV